VSGVAPDGSPVTLYARLPSLGAEILELGAGAGRVTHPLVALGHAVVAVDNSEEMLALIDGAETVLADIETLDLGRRFPVVVLASNFINHPDDAERRGFLGSCARHVLPDGQVLLQGFPRDWIPSTQWAQHGDVRVRLRSFTVDAAVVSGEMEYVVGRRRVFHAFESRLLTSAELDEDLGSVGLRRVRELDDRGSWIEAAPLRS